MLKKKDVTPYSNESPPLGPVSSGQVMALSCQVQATGHPQACILRAARLCFGPPMAWRASVGCASPCCSQPEMGGPEPSKPGDPQKSDRVLHHSCGRRLRVAGCTGFRQPCPNTAWARGYAPPSAQGGLCSRFSSGHCKGASLKDRCRKGASQFIFKGQVNQPAVTARRPARSPGRRCHWRVRCRRPRRRRRRSRRSRRSRRRWRARAMR
ncbi:MAG: hypothetical protein J3K34DRAFT_413175 [Monoraphidium minutum]|nr:MAG: hypothetical protein J3K34DRAFT_413175 [Monoraphidium minutum]